MNCRTIRAEIHRWMDSQEPGALPESVRAHIRDCASCHAFIKEWNAIEVGMVSMRSAAPVLSGGFTAALDARLSGVQQGSALTAWFRRLVPPRQARLALAGGSAALALWLTYLASTTVMTAMSRHGSTSMAASGEIRRTEPATPIPAQIQITPTR